MTLGDAGAGHEDQRGDAVAVGHPARDPAAKSRWWSWQQRPDALPAGYRLLDHAPMANPGSSSMPGMASPSCN
jgi:hypothetical protein